MKKLMIVFLILLLSSCVKFDKYTYYILVCVNANNYVTMRFETYDKIYQTDGKFYNDSFSYSPKLTKEVCRIDVANAYKRASDN